METTEKKSGKITHTVVAFAKNQPKGNQYINLLVRIERPDGTGSYLARDKFVSDEAWAEAGRRLKNREAVLYENVFKPKTDSDKATEAAATEGAPF